MTPSDLGFVLLLLLVTFSEVRSYHRAKKFKTAAFHRSVAIRRPS